MIKIRLKESTAETPKKIKKSDVCKEHVCPYAGCTKVFNRPYRLKQHISAAHTGQKEFACPEHECQKVYASKYKLHLHLKNQHRKTASPLNHSIFGKSDLIFNMSEVAAPPKLNTPVKCQDPICQRVYASKHSMLKHFKNAHISKLGFQFNCDSCASQFKTRIAIEDHWFAHLGMTPYSCDFCSRVFCSLRLLKKHAQYHAWYYCPQPECSDLIIGKRKFNRHLLKVHKIGFVKCEECGKQFTEKCHLSRHIKETHFRKSQSWECTHCLRIYKHKRNFDMHMIIKHSFLRIPCNFCEQTFATNQKLKEHTKLHEPGHSTQRSYPKGGVRKQRKDAGTLKNSIAKLLAGDKSIL